MTEICDRYTQKPTNQDEENKLGKTPSKAQTEAAIPCLWGVGGAWDLAGGWGKGFAHPYHLGSRDGADRSGDGAGGVHQAGPEESYTISIGRPHKFSCHRICGRREMGGQGWRGKGGGLRM